MQNENKLAETKTISREKFDRAVELNNRCVQLERHLHDINHIITRSVAPSRGLCLFLYTTNSAGERTAEGIRLKFPASISPELYLQAYRAEVEKAIRELEAEFENLLS